MTTKPQPTTTPTSFWESIVSPAGYILAFSYPVLALSTGVRALYQLLTPTTTNYFPPAMSAVAAFCYLVATLGFAYRRQWTWWLSMSFLGIETLLTLIVGTWSILDPGAVGRTVWRHYGEDYGYFPLVQPILGLLWLLWPPTLTLYGWKQAATNPE